MKLAKDVMQGSLFLRFKGLPWARLFRLGLKISWGVVMVALSLVLIFFKIAALLAQRDESKGDSGDDGLDVFDGESFGKGTLYVDHSTGEESPMPLTGFHRI